MTRAGAAAALASAVAVAIAACAAPEREPAARRPATVECAGDGAARVCTVTGLFADAPAARLALAGGVGAADTLRLTLTRPGAAALPLPTFHGSRVWGACAPAADARGLPRLDRLAAADVDDDGREDLVVVGECMTGIGPTAARPFAAGAVYLDDGRGAFRADPRVDSVLTDLAAACDGACDVRALAREAVRRARGGSG